MAPKTEQERLFGAACVRVTLERTGRDPTSVSLYVETLDDLDLSDEAVRRYLSEHRADVEAKLEAHRRAGGGR